MGGETQTTSMAKTKETHMIHLPHLWKAKQDQIRLHLEAGFSLTREEAALQFGHWNLPSVINRLRALGIPIKKVMQDGKARYSIGLNNLK